MTDQNEDLGERWARELREAIANGELASVPYDPTWIDDNPDPIVAKPAVVLRPLGDIIAERREPEWLPGLVDILERGVLAVLAGPRGSFKSFIGLHWVLTTAAHGEPVVILSGEGAGLDRRADAWLRVHAPGRTEPLPVHCCETALNLNEGEDLENLSYAIKGLPRPPGLVLVDTLSKFSAGMDENSNSEVSAYLSRLTAAIRERFGCTVLLVVHTGHAEVGRPRGASALMANPDAEYIVKRPSPLAKVVQVNRDRFKDGPALPALGFEAQVVDLGRNDKHGRPVTSLVLQPLAALGEPEEPKEPRGKAVEPILRALRAQADAHAKQKDNGPLIWTLEEMREIGRNLGLHRNSARQAVDKLVLSGLLTPTVGGHRLK